MSSTPSAAASAAAAVAYGDNSLVKNEVPLLRVAAGDADGSGGDALTAALRPLLFPADGRGAKLSDVSDEEALDAAGALAAYLTAEAAAMEAEESAQLRPRRDAAQLRLLEDAEAAIVSGLDSAGRARREDFRDALVILRGITESPQGRRDYAVWLQVGWLLWQTEAPTEECEEAFYQAARLSRGTPGAYFGIASRHVAATQQLLGHPSEAAATVAAALEALGDDPLLLWEAARAASAAGKTEESVAFVERCLAALPPLTPLLFHDPLLEPQRGPIAAVLKRRRADALERAQSSTERWRRALDLIRRAEVMGELTLPVADHLTEAAIDALTPEGEAECEGCAAEALGQAGAALEQIIEETRQAEYRLRRHIDQLHRDKETWEKSLVALRSEAEAMGVSLDHPPAGKGLLRKKNPQHERVFVNFHSCRNNLAKVNTELRDTLPQIRTNLAQTTKRLALLEKTAAWLSEQGAGLV